MADDIRTTENTDNKSAGEISPRKIKVYLDNCAYNRPYDDQSQAKIELETQAKLKIQRMIENQQIELASSYMSLYECGENPDASKAELITAFINQQSSVHVSLKNKVGTVDTEEFISFVKSDQFDYTKWQRDHFDAKTPEQISAEATAYVTEHPYAGDPATII